MLASIDVGSNTLRLLLGTVDNGNVVPVEYVRRITRLKGGQTETGLAPDAMNRSISALKEFSEIIARYTPSSIRVVGTEALRSSFNSSEFTSRVFVETGLTLEIVDGNQEALLTAKGVSSILKDPSIETILVFDIGGGSTEFVLMHYGVILFKKSVQLGVVDLSESSSCVDRRLDSIRTTIAELNTAIDPILQQHNVSHRDISLIGTAGTVTTLAAMDMQMVEYDWRRVNGYTLNIASIVSMQQQLSRLSCVEREALPGMEQGRGDLIPAGIEITLEIMRQFQSETLTISDFGLLEGILLTMPPNSRKTS